MSEMPPIPKAVRPRRRWVTIFLSLVLLASGAAIGSGLTLLVVVRGVQNRLHHPEQFPSRSAARLRTFLSLSPEQTRQIESILRDHQGRIQEVRRQAQPKLEQQVDQIRDEISAVLTPAQATKWQSWLEAKRRLWLPAVPASKDAP